ncbi:MAG: hypothetical protein J6X67_04185 [Treponema sp.]|nr:hypothetical protein [Treponema sp.]
MNIKKVFSNELYDCREFYNYFSKDEIQNLPYGLYTLIEEEQKNENELIFQNLIEFICDLYVSLNISNDDFEYIDSKLDEIGFCEKFSAYLNSDFLFKKQGTILAFAKMRKSDNCKYLEEAFINYYHKKNPILASTCLKELFYLKSKKATEYEDLLFHEIDLINLISIILLDDNELTDKALKLYRNKKFLKNITSENLVDFAMSFEIFITNVQGVNHIKDFNRDEYIKSINYFEEIYDSYKVEDYKSFYKKALQEIRNNHIVS